MKSEVIVINDGNTEEALELTERFTNEFSPKSALRIRLIAEETMNLVRAIAGDMDAQYWLEKEDDICKIHLNTNTVMFAQKRKELLEVSTKKENAAARGVLGKVREVFELALLPKDERTARESKVGMMGLVDPTSLSATTNTETWKMSSYVNAVNDMEPNEFAQEARNELERSILGNLAKDVTIAIVGDDVKMTIEYVLD
jgi:hypothetical protein